MSPRLIRDSVFGFKWSLRTGLLRAPNSWTGEFRCSTAETSQILRSAFSVEQTKFAELLSWIYFLLSRVNSHEFKMMKFNSLSSSPCMWSFWEFSPVTKGTKLHFCVICDPQSMVHKKGARVSNRIHDFRVSGRNDDMRRGTGRRIGVILTPCTTAQLVICTSSVRRISSNYQVRRDKI